LDKGKIIVVTLFKQKYSNMTVKEKVEKEIAQLSTIELMKLHDIIISLRRKKTLSKLSSNKKSPYLRVREALKGIGNLSGDIIEERTEIL
jgi:uncharacterized membrane protein